MSLSLTQQADIVRPVLEKNQKLSRADLQILRENSGAAAFMSSKADGFSFRMEIEHIDAIRALDETSTKLAKVGIAVAIVAVLLGALQIVLATLK